MVRLKGYFVKTDIGVYDLSGPSESKFKIVKYGNIASLFSIANNKIIADVIETFNTFEDLIQKGKDIVEIREPNTLVRYAVIQKVIEDKVLTNEGLVDPAYITAVLEYNDWTDSYTRFVII